MTATVRKLRTTGYGDPRVEQLARDVQQRFDLSPPVALIAFTDVYAEPMSVAFDHEPAVLRLGRVQHDASPEDAIAASALVSFTYRDGQLVIPVLEGLTLGTKYRFCFEAVG